MKPDRVLAPLRRSRWGARLGAVAIVCIALSVPAAVAEARVTVTPVPVPAAEKPSGEIKATVTVSQEDDVFDLSPGMDYSSAMSWWSTKEEGDRSPMLTSLSGKGNFGATVDANIVYPLETVCGNWHYKLNASGDVDSLSNLNFSFVPKDIMHPKLGLKGWSVQTPLAQWRGQLEVQKNAPCDTSTQDGGASFDGASLVGGSKTGGTPIAEPKVVMNKSGGVTISGQGTVAVPNAVGAITKKQVITFKISCARYESCFGYPEDGSNGVEHGWKYRGATCEKGPSGTVRLRVKMRMTLRNGKGIRNWAQGMRAEARLVPTTGGFNFGRNWRGQTVKGFAQGKRYVQDFEFVTDTVSPTKEWALELKYTWIRDVDNDVVEQFKGKMPISCLNDPSFVGGA